jgi:carbon storage regulator
MLVLSRKRGESIMIGADIKITIVDIDRGKVRVGIRCPREVPVLREEIITRKVSRRAKEPSHA